MNPARCVLVFLALSAPVLGGCSKQQADAFMRNINESGGLKQTLTNLREPTQAQEIEIGDGVAETLLGARPLLDDLELQRYVNAVGMWVAQQSERPDLPWHFGVNDSDHINAFAAPGGYIIVTKGMMKQLRNEAELAGVLGHEVAHVTQKHHLKALRKSALVNLLSAGAAAATAESRHAEVVQKLAGPTKELYARGLDKADEFEADRMGVVLAARAGYDPYGLPAVLTTLASADPKDNFLTLLTKTHPLPQVRLDSLAPGLATLDDIKATQIPARFQQYTRKLHVASQ
ncbi:MAG TPA: M48 family metalloprotease [Burkholderiales bacterium]|nr:M48 family metalloprotease [Burkholderiales bacterium]